MFVIFGNYGNGTIALIQWMSKSFEKKQSETLRSVSRIRVVSIDTGWAAEGWIDHVNKCEEFARSSGFKVERIKAPLSFAELVKDRKAFPSQKFQWCPTLLKGMPLLDYLDNIDPNCEATIILGKRQVDSRASFELPEFIEASDFFNGRKIWHPLYKHTDQDFEKLIKETGIKKLESRSLECNPCINSSANDFQNMNEKDIKKMQKLEKEVGEVMLPKKLGDPKHPYDLFARGCGDTYCCGI